MFEHWTCQELQYSAWKAYACIFVTIENENEAKLSADVPYAVEEVDIFDPGLFLA